MFPLDTLLIPSLSPCIYDCRYTPRAYVVAATDNMSGKKAAGLEATIAEAKVKLLLIAVSYI